MVVRAEARAEPGKTKDRWRVAHALFLANHFICRLLYIINSCSIEIERQAQLLSLSPEAIRCNDGVTHVQSAGGLWCAAE